MSANARRIVQRTVDTNALLAARAERDALAAENKRLREALAIALPYVEKVAATMPTEMNRMQRRNEARNHAAQARAALAETARKGG